MSRFFFDDDADLSLLDGRSVAVIGYGNQGRSQALNMKDMGVDVVVGNIEDEYADIARADGWDLLTIEDAAARADVLMMLTSDDSQPDVYENQVKKSLKPGDVMSFAHGFNIHYREIVPVPDIDVVMVAPRMLGEGVRATFLEGRGFPSLIAVAQNASGKALEPRLFKSHRWVQISLIWSGHSFFGMLSGRDGDERRSAGLVFVA